jgi:hypothetical protein
MAATGCAHRDSSDSQLELPVALRHRWRSAGPRPAGGLSQRPVADAECVVHWQRLSSLGPASESRRTSAESQLSLGQAAWQWLPEPLSALEHHELSCQPVPQCRQRLSNSFN